MGGFFADKMDYVFAVYGLSYMILGVVCLMMTQRVKYRLTWQYLGAFGLVHGLNEWLAGHGGNKLWR